MTGSIPDTLHAALDNLSDGVLVIDLDGAIRLANPAFRRMFGLGDDDPTERNFGSLFVLAEGLDEFSEAVLDAVARRGAVERRLVQVDAGSGSRSLTVTAAPLAGTQETAGAVIVTISDITEIRELRDAELRLARQVESQLGELQAAYRDLESRSREIASMTRRARIARAGFVILALALFVGLGAWRLQPLDLFGAVPDPVATAAVPEPLGGELRTVTITPTDMETAIALRGRLGLGLVAEIVSPFEGHLSAVHVRPGAEVTESAPLLAFDTGRLATELRRAEVEEIRAREKLAGLEDWANSDEMARARAARRRARIALEEAEEAKLRAAFLLEQGIIAEQEHEQAVRSLDNRRLDDDAAARELAAVERKAGDEALRIARIEAESARARLQTHRDSLDRATIRAPITGVFIADEGRNSKPLVAGRPVTQGERLASVADFSRLSVVTYVDEVDVRRLAVGQPARVTGPGFPGPPIDGTVTHVAARAAAGNQRGAPRFPITVDLDRLDSPDRARLRVGMSAHVEIVVHRRADALLVPLAAIGQDRGAPTLRIVDAATGAVEERAIVTGLTTLDSVEVIEGLAAGETVALPW